MIQERGVNDEDPGRLIGARRLVLDEAGAQCERVHRAALHDHEPWRGRETFRLRGIHVAEASVDLVDEAEESRIVRDLLEGRIRAGSRGELAGRGKGRHVRRDRVVARELPVVLVVRHRARMSERCADRPAVDCARGGAAVVGRRAGGAGSNGGCEEEK